MAHVVVEIDHNLRLHSSVVIKTAVVVDSERFSMMVDFDLVNTARRGGDEVLLDLQLTPLVWICHIVQVLVFAVGGLQLVTAQERDNCCLALHGASHERNSRQRLSVLVYCICLLKILTCGF